MPPPLLLLLLSVSVHPLPSMLQCLQQLTLSSSRQQELQVLLQYCRGVRPHITHHCCSCCCHINHRLLLLLLLLLLLQ